MRPRVSLAQFNAMAKRVGGKARVTDADEPHANSSAPSPYRSKLEEDFAGYLELQKRIGEIRGWWYEQINFRLPGKKNSYKPDFLVQYADYSLWVYEVKGRNKSDDCSLVKIKTAAGLNPWTTFVWVTRVNGVWEEREIR